MFVIELIDNMFGISSLSDSKTINAIMSSGLDFGIRANPEP